MLHMIATAAILSQSTALDLETSVYWGDNAERYEGLKRTHNMKMMQSLYRKDSE